MAQGRLNSWPSLSGARPCSASVSRQECSRARAASCPVCLETRCPRAAEVSFPELGCFEICKQLRLDTLCCQMQWPNREKSPGAAAELTQEAAGPGQSRVLPPGLLIWPRLGRSMGGETGLTLPLHCLSQGLASLLPTRDSGLSLLARGLQLPWGTAPGFWTVPQGEGAVGRHEEGRLWPISARRQKWTLGCDPGGCTRFPAAPSLARAGAREPQGR